MWSTSASKRINRKKKESRPSWLSFPIASALLLNKLTNLDWPRCWLGNNIINTIREEKQCSVVFAKVRGCLLFTFKQTLLKKGFRVGSGLTSWSECFINTASMSRLRPLKSSAAKRPSVLEGGASCTLMQMWAGSKSINNSYFFHKLSTWTRQPFALVLSLGRNDCLQTLEHDGGRKRTSFWTFHNVACCSFINEV